jgi:RNA polymerase sigma-70 factor, ECF subfamily
MSSTLPLKDLASDARQNALLRQVAGGDKAALGELYDRFSQPLYALARYVLNDPMEAEDILHEVFITLAAKASEFDAERGSAFSWAATLTRNKAIDRVRRRRRQGELLAQRARLDFASAQESEPAADPFRTAELSAAVQRGFAALPEEQRRALELAYFSGLTQQEIAKQLATPLGTVKARIRRGLLSLRTVLDFRP